MKAVSTRSALLPFLFLCFCVKVAYVASELAMDTAVSCMFADHPPRCAALSYGCLPRHAHATVFVKLLFILILCTGINRTIAWVRQTAQPLCRPRPAYQTTCWPISSQNAGMPSSQYATFDLSQVPFIPSPSEGL